MTSKVLIVNQTFPQAGLKYFVDNNVEPTVLPLEDFTPDAMSEIKAKIGAGYDALIWNTKFNLTDELLELAGPKLKAISTMSSGVNNIDIPAVKRRGLPLGNTTHALHSAVAELTIGLMVAAARRFKEGHRMIENNEWKAGVQWLLGQNIEGSTVGVVGLGGIGLGLVKRLKAFDVAKFLYSGRSEKPEAKALGVEKVPLDQLLKESDFVILSCPLTAETKHLINEEALRMMKRNAILINVARGEVVDHEALYSALKEKRIYSAGLDVTTPEPLPSEHPLNALPNCYIVPHLGSATFETRNEMSITAAKNIVFALQGKLMHTSVV